MTAWRGFVDDAAVLTLDDRKAFAKSLEKLTGCEVAVTVTQRRHARSLDQNAYWWAVPVKILAEELGYTPAQMHSALLGECFGYKAGPLGNAVPNRPSSSDLTVPEFSHLIEWVLDWAPSTLNIVIPAPTDPLGQELVNAS